MNNFVVCKHCSVTLLLDENVASSLVMPKMWNFTREKKNCWFNRLKTRSITLKRNCCFRSSCSLVFLKIVILKNLASFARKHLQAFRPATLLIWNFTCEKEHCLFNRLKTRSITLKRNCCFRRSCSQMF